MKAPWAIQAVATGVNITTGAASANAAIPNTSQGTRPYYVRLAATAACHARLFPGVGVATAVATDMLVQPGDSVILAVGGNTHIAAIQSAAAGVLNVTPLEDA